LACVKALIEAKPNGADINLKWRAPTKDISPLHLSIYQYAQSENEKALEIFEYLIEQGADINDEGEFSHPLIKDGVTWRVIMKGVISGDNIMVKPALESMLSKKKVVE